MGILFEKLQMVLCLFRIILEDVAPLLIMNFDVVVFDPAMFSFEQILKFFFEFRCPFGLAFDEVNLMCNWP